MSGMGSAPWEGMDAVMFAVKGAHLAVQRFGRAMVRRSRAVGMTPARFDLMNALGRWGMQQSELWKRLNVVKSVVSEMVTALGALGWVERLHDSSDRRTWLVRLTARGRDVFARVCAQWVDSGDATLTIDASLANGFVEIDAWQARTELVEACEKLSGTFRTRPPFVGADLYLWCWEDIYARFAVVGEALERDAVPFVA